MSDQLFNIVRVLYHQIVNVNFVSTGQHCKLAHCDRAFVQINSNTWPTKNIIQQICHKVYAQWLKKNKFFVALLELNVSNGIEISQIDGTSANYSLIIGVASVSNQSDLICVTITANSLLRPENKCFEITKNYCYQRPYHVVSPSQSLSNYKCLITDNYGWIMVIPSSKKTVCPLILTRQYVAIGKDQNICLVNSKKGTKVDLLSGDMGLLVKYGAIISLNAESNISDGDTDNSKLIFIGERHNNLFKLAQIQDKLNLNVECSNKDSMWPELPKCDNSSFGENAAIELTKSTGSKQPTEVDDGQLSSESSAATNHTKYENPQPVVVEEMANGTFNADSSVVVPFYQAPVFYYGAWCYSPHVVLYSNCYYNTDHGVQY